MFLTVVGKSISLSLVIAFTILTGMSQDTYAWCWFLKTITSLYKKQQSSPPNAVFTHLAKELQSQG